MRLKSKIITLIITLSAMECLYLFAFPFVIDKVINSNKIKNILNSNPYLSINYSQSQIKTHLKPDLSFSFNNLNITFKNKKPLITTNNIMVRLSILDILFKKINIKTLNSDNLILYLEKNENGKFNFEELFPESNNKKYKIKFKNNLINIQNYKIKIKNKIINEKLKINANPLKIIAQKNKILKITTNGEIKNNSNVSNFDINFLINLPLNKNIDTDMISGSFFIENLDVKSFYSYLSNYISPNIKLIDGYIDYIKITTEQSTNNIILNTKINNYEFDYNGWENHIKANGENNISANIELHKNIIKINSLSYIAEGINAQSSGLIKFEQKKKPFLNLNVNVENSKAEKISPILPPNLPVEYRTTEKIKRYGVFGDVEGKMQITGYIPHPDIEGYVKGENVHILDKSLHKLHKGTVNLKFNKRILNMDILIDLYNKQKAIINGYVYMYRDGINKVKIKTSDNIDFSLAQKIVVPISKVFNFQLGPIPEMNITSGTGIIDIDIEGSMDFISINGYSSFDNAKLTYNGLYGEINKGKGRLDFKNDIINFKTEKAFVKMNPLNVNGRVKINNYLDFNINSELAKAEDLLELINKSSLLKDVKAGMAVITKAQGDTKVSVNMKAKIVPVAFGQPPLPPEEAFEDMKIKGSLYMFGTSCFIEGFKTPIENIKGIVDFTETIVNLNDLTAVSGTSPLTIKGQIINDLETKIPDIDLTITSNNVNLKDTIRFLTQSYLYPENYPDLSSLYKIASKHDLYFKYKAKSIDFLTDKAYAVMNFIPDKENNPIKATSGKVILDKSKVKVDNINALLFDSAMTINGEVLHVDTVNPIYNLKINTENFNIENLNDTSKITIIPPQVRQFFNSFKDYQGKANINIDLTKNILNGEVNFNKLKLKHFASGIPFNFDNFSVFIKNNNIIINNITADIGSIPFFGSLTISDIYKLPTINGFFTSKITNDFIKNYLPKEYSSNLTILGDITFSSQFRGNENNFIIEPKFILNENADIIYKNINFGETTEKREFTGNIAIQKDQIDINKIDYIKYINSQNNKTYPIRFSTLNGILKKQDNTYIPEIINFKTDKNLSARLLNIFLKNPIIKQGTFNCDLKYTSNPANKISSLLGKMDCRNLDIPLFDTLLKNIKINAQKEEINVNLIGYMADSKLNIKSSFLNNLSDKLKINSLYIYSDYFNNNKLLEQLSKTHQAINKNNELKNIDLSGLSLENGLIEIKELAIKSLIAKNLKSKFSIDENGIFTANDLQVNVGEGFMNGKFSYNLNSNETECNFELNNVDSNYIAQTLFDGEDQIYGNANGKLQIKTKGTTPEERINNLDGYIEFNITDGRMPKLGSLEYLLRASNIIKSGFTGFTLNSILELLNLVKTGYFSNIYGSCIINKGIAQNIEIFSKGENLSLYIHGNYDITKTHANFEILGKLSKKISTIFGKVGNTSLNTFFKLIPGISLLDFGKKDFIENVEKIPSFTHGDYESRTFQAIIDGNINDDSNYVQSFKWVKQ